MNGQVKDRRRGELHSPPTEKAAIVHETFAATVDAPAQARALIRAALDCDPRVGAAQLAVSELVTNAILHGGLGSHAEVEVHVRCTSAHVRVSVVHAGDGRHADRGRGGVGGWGLPIVASLASAWSLDSVGATTVAWFEL